MHDHINLFWAAFPLVSVREGLVSAGFWWKGLVSAGFGSFQVVSAGFGSFRFLVITILVDLNNVEVKDRDNLNDIGLCENEIVHSGDTEPISSTHKTVTVTNGTQNKKKNL